MAIASCRVDTNILLRISRRFDPQYKLVASALAKLALAGTTLHFTHQNIAELWNAKKRERMDPRLTKPTIGAGAYARAPVRIPAADRGRARDLELGRAVERLRGATRPRRRF
jgi:hypothetical protein